MRDPSDAEDLEKVAQFLAGDTAAYEFLFEKYRDKVFGIAYRYTRNKDDALEVTQEVFLRVWLSLAKFKTESKFFTWLYRITVNRSIDFTRSRKNQPVLGLETPALDAAEEATHRRSPAPDPTAGVEEKELAEHLRRAVDTLSSKHRSTFILHAYENLSYKETAEVLGCNIGTVMSRLFYARKKLQEILTQAGHDFSQMQREPSEEKGKSAPSGRGRGKPSAPAKKAGKKAGKKAAKRARKKSK